MNSNQLPKETIKSIIKKEVIKRWGKPLLVEPNSNDVMLFNLGWDTAHAHFAKLLKQAGIK